MRRRGRGRHGQPSSARPLGSVTVEAQALLPMIWADPQHMPEQLAFFAVRRFGHRAAAAVTRRRERAPGSGPEELDDAVIAHGTRMTIAEGAMLGGPFIVLMPVSFVAALLARAQMVLEIAAVAGLDPHSERRVADLLFLQDVYPSVEEAAKALAHAERHPVGHHGRVPRRTRWALLVRMAALLGLIGGGEERSRTRRVLSTASIVALFAVGMVLPLIWVPAMAVLYRQATLQLGAKAVGFYSAGATTGGKHTRRTIRVPKAAGVLPLLRLFALALAPLVMAAVAVLVGLRIAGGTWGTGLILLFVLSLLASGLWFLHRRSRRSRRAAA
ncbi:hypothetical protein [Streptomyces cinnamoneus]|uniref:hypothetical protein n=1 Tax=Streptomyces cinnamoneus TaxID=53446 RepID=UPI00379B6E96